jgi:hypothetical protein
LMLTDVVEWSLPACVLTWHCKEELNSRQVRYMYACLDQVKV